MWSYKAPLPAPRYAQASAVVNGILYVMGGGYLNTMVAYNPATNTWTTKASMPSTRWNSTCGVINGQIYLVGGWGGGSCCPNNNLWVYDPPTDTWTSRAPMPILSACGVAGVINNKLYVTTSCNGYSGLRNFLHVYDPATDSWTQLPNSPNIHGEGPAGGVINGKLYVAGGIDQEWTDHPGNALDVYDPATNTWTTKTPMPTNRYDIAGGIMHGKLYAAGGYNGTTILNTVEAYDPSTNTWSAQAPMLTNRYIASGSVINNNFYVAGGINSGAVLASVEVYAPTSATSNAVITANSPLTFCTGNTVTLAASQGVSYLWNNGATTQTITVSNPGNYIVTVTSANGCIAKSAPVTVTVNPLPTITTTNSGVSCAGASDGSITVSASGTTPFLYSNDNGSSYQTGNVFSGLSSGVYNIKTKSIITGCISATQPVTITTLPDTIPPILNGVPLNTTASCDAVPSAAAVTATDNCDPQPVIIFNETSTQNTDINSPAHYNYTITRTWTAKDRSGNTSAKTQVIIVQDKTAPVAICKPITIQLVNGTANITASDVNNGSYDNCSPVKLNVSRTSFNCASLGVNNVILSVTDVSGNSGSCTTQVTVIGEKPSCNILSIPSGNIYTGGISTNLYLGYGAQSTTLSVIVPASGAPYTYAWTATNNGAGMLNNITGKAPIFQPSVSGNYTFTVLVTNKYGCTSSCSINICVTDIRVVKKEGNNEDEKVYLCHQTNREHNAAGGTNERSNRVTLAISVNAVAAHLANHPGDRLGGCDQLPCTTYTSTITASRQAITREEASVKTIADQLKITLSPNPGDDYFNVKLQSKFSAPVHMQVTDAAGRLIENRAGIDPNGSIQIGHQYNNGIYYASFTQGNTRKVVQLIKVKQ
jgi:N-acetylneuraminic acid mutarotase